MDLVDIEEDAGEEFKAEIIREARRYGSRVIISHHDDEQTPTRRELEAIIARSFEAGADFVKIACRANSASDSARLIGLLDDPRCQGKLIVVGMGTFGSITRILAPFLGSPFTYASLEEGYETAPGQVGYRELARIHRDLLGILEK
jgi:3-dehydroquinate dehydratase type I